MTTTSQPRIAAIVAMSQNRVIGKNNQLPWHMPADLKHFKLLTTNHAIIMGRKTYETIGRPLPNRTNIILTRAAHYQAEGCFTANSFEQALEIAAEKNPNQEIFVIGGAQIYQQLLPLVQHIYLTIIHHDFMGDAFFPEIDKLKWKELECITHLADEANPYNYSFIQLGKRPPLVSI
nr:Dihydrofolate reductase [uncultured bacterium]